MKSKKNISNCFNKSILICIAIVSMLTIPFPSQANETIHNNNLANNLLGQTLHFEIAEDHTRFSFDEAPVFDDGGPKAGNAFVTHGYIYRKGFFDIYSDGVDEQGQPIRPDLVIGEWTCRGYFVGDGMNTKTGPVVISTQTFDFYDRPGYHRNQNRQFGKRMVTTEGYELIDLNKPVKRAITGGTGRYRSTKGQHKQILLGLSKFGGVKTIHKLKLQRL